MGYKRLKISKNKTRDEHRVLMEQALGRTLDRLEHVHHKDGNKRIAEGKRNVEIAKEFRISRPLVSQIRHGKRWS
jgi:hypothetical protein